LSFNLYYIYNKTPEYSVKFILENLCSVIVSYEVDVSILVNANRLLDKYAACVIKKLPNTYI